MGNFLRASLAGACLSFAGIATVTAAAPPPVGLKVLAETWNPAQFPGENVATLESSPTAVSDALNQAWGSFRSWYLTTLPPRLAGADYLHQVAPDIPKGITLYSRSHDFHKPPELTLPQQPELKLVAEGPNAFEANFHVPASTISLCATTPTPAGKYGDPCATLSVDVYLSVAIKINDDASKMLQVTGASVSLNNFSYGNENLPTEVVEALADVFRFFGGPDYQALLVKTIDSQRQDVTNAMQKPLTALNTQLGTYEQKALAAINQPLQPAGVSFSRLAHLAVWARSSSTAQSLTLLLAPPNGGASIDPSRQSGQFSGTLSFDSSVQTLPQSCAQLNGSPQITGQVQTGPRPVVALDAAFNPVYGNAPMQGLSVAFSGGALQGRQCSYTLTRIAVGLPNILNFTNIQVKRSGMPQVDKTLQILPSHWASPVVVGPNGAIVAVAGAAAAGSGTRTAVPIQLANRDAGGAQSMALIASTGLVVDTGAGALPRSGLQQVGKVNPGDPSLGVQTRTTTSAANPAAAVTSSAPAMSAATPAATVGAAAAKAPSWNQPGASSTAPVSGGVATGGFSTGVSTSGFSPAASSMRGSTYGAPSSTVNSSLQRGQSTLNQGTQQTIRAPASIGAQ